MGRFSLRQIFILGATLGITLPALILGSFWVSDRYAREVNTRVQVPLTQYADMLSDGLAIAIWNVDKDVAAKLVDAVMRNPEVVRVLIQDEFKETFTAAEVAQRRGGKLLSESRTVYFGGRLVGFVTIELSTARVEGEFRSDLVNQALALLVQVIVSLGVIVLLFEFRLIRPLRALQGAANRLARGELDLPIASRRHDEIGELAHDLDTMRGNLARLISAKLQSAQQIQNLNATLEERVAERTGELAVALIKLQTAHDELVRSEKLSALGSLVAGIAHELNTPIGNSLTVASTLQDNVDEFEKKLQHGVSRRSLDQMLTRTRDGTDILLHSLGKAVELIASFKQVAVDQTSANRRTFDLRETVGEIITTLGPMIRKTPYVVSSAIPEGISMESYPGPLGQIITNLINNAFLHGFDGASSGSVTITAEHSNIGSVALTITDNGHGIPTENLNRIFDPFFTTKLGQGGSGLGLNIVYNLVTGPMGGEITVQSRPGQGSSFMLRLPLVAPGETVAPLTLQG